MKHFLIFASRESGEGCIGGCSVRDM